MNARYFWTRKPPLASCGLALLIAASACWSEPARAVNPIPGAPQTKAIALVGGTVHPLSGPSLEQATILFEKGKITAVGTDVKLPAQVERIDVSGKHVYPGMIDPYSQLGLVEIPAVRAMVDMSEVGTFNPNVKAWVAFHSESELIPVTRANGVLFALTAPTGGVVPGLSAVMQLDGWTYEDMALKAPVALHIEWPLMSPQGGLTDDARQKQLKKRDDTLRQLHELFEQARHYRLSKQAHEPAATPEKKKTLEQTEAAAAFRHNVRLEALLPVLAGDVPVMVTADDQRQIQAAISFALRERIKLILHGGYDAAECAELLKEHRIPVILDGVHRLPLRDDDPYDAPYTLAKRLQQAGVTFCISSSDRTANLRNLPYHAAAAAAHGLPADDALKSITLYPAQILGVADRIGSLEAGKDASLIVTTGSPLDIRTRIEAAFVQGRRVDLNNRQLELYRKYDERAKRLPPVK